MKAGNCQVNWNVVASLSIAGYNTNMKVLRIFAVFIVALSLLTATGAAFASVCICNHAAAKEGMDCHKHMAKQEKKSCCCDKMMGCKVSFNILGSGEPIAFLSSTASYYLSKQHAHSLHLVPAAQPPKA